MFLVFICESWYFKEVDNLTYILFILPLFLSIYSNTDVCVSATV